MGIAFLASHRSAIFFQSSSVGSTPDGLCATVWKTKTEPSLALPKSSSIASRSRPIVCCATHAHTHRFGQHAACLICIVAYALLQAQYVACFSSGGRGIDADRLATVSATVPHDLHMSSFGILPSYRAAIYMYDLQSTKRDCTLLLPPCDACCIYHHL